jgi:PII-like signaling protein
MDLRQLSLGAVIVRRYGRYDVNGFCFRSTRFEDAHPLVATTNVEVVTIVVDDEGKMTNYYGVINDILKYKFFGDKKLKVVVGTCSQQQGGQQG